MLNWDLPRRSILRNVLDKDSHVLFPKIVEFSSLDKWFSSYGAFKKLFILTSFSIWSWFRFEFASNWVETEFSGKRNRFT